MGSKISAAGLVAHCKTKVGTPYVYGAKGYLGPFTKTRLDMLARMYPNIFTRAYIDKATQYIGQVCTDCSGLIAWYTEHNLGSSQLCRTANKRIPVSNIKDAPSGAVMWRNGHVGVLSWENGKPYVYEARGIAYGTVKSPFSPKKWTYALLFDYMDYKVKTNPYQVSSRVIKQGMVGEDVKWLQYELNEAGAELKIDGVFGSKTLKALKAFQQSCKIEKDGKCGPITKKELLAV